MKSIYLFLLISICGCVVSGNIDMVVPDHKNVFDLNLYESVLDEELCEEQIRHILQNETALFIEFLDAGIRTPRGVLTGNVVDLGNYFQCLGIRKEITNSVVEGKYCMIDVPLDQNWPSLRSTTTLPDEWPDVTSPDESPDITWPERPDEWPNVTLPDEWSDITWPGLPDEWPNVTLPDEWPDITWPGQHPKRFWIKEDAVERSRQYQLAAAGFEAFNGAPNINNRVAGTPLAALSLRLGTCIPKSCTPRTALNALFGTSEIRFLQFDEAYCRLPNDKRWVTGEYVALTIFGFFILLCALSTGYDIRYNVYQQKDPKKINKLLLAFSAYTNTHRLVTYNPVPGALECLDGIRAFAMMWVIIGHTFVTQTGSQIMANPADVLDWITSLKSVWITAALITVDTFFMMSGLLLVYTTAGKLSSMKLIKSLHLFYLNRLLRMFPPLAAVILLQISILSRVSDGPFWSVMAAQTHRCRVYWWSTLLHIQNYINPSHMCLAHSWYLALDVQLHFLSPIVLVWVLTGKRRLAWSALVGSMIAILAAATTYNFIKEFPSGPVIPSRPLEAEDYITYYYVNTLTRASPFFVGLIIGYILHLNRGKKVSINPISASILWICTTVIALLTIYSSYPIMQLDWDNQFADSMINSFMRPAWAMFVGWLIFACEHGYGGPVNWILSHRAWKVLSRLSYAMYLVHYPMMFLINAMPIVPIYFDIQFSLFRFLADFSLAVIVAFLITIIIDSPCSVLIKHVMGGGSKRPPPKIVGPELIEEKKSKEIYV